MRLFKLIFVLLVLGTIGLFLYENLATFNASQGFKLDLSIGSWKLDVFQIKIELYIVLLISAALGFLFGLSLLFKPWRRARKALKQERQKQPAAPAPMEPAPKPDASPEEPAPPPGG